MSPILPRRLRRNRSGSNRSGVTLVPRYRSTGTRPVHGPVERRPVQYGQDSQALDFESRPESLPAAAAALCLPLMEQLDDATRANSLANTVRLGELHTAEWMNDMDPDEVQGESSGEEEMELAESDVQSLGDMEAPIPASVQEHARAPLPQQDLQQQAREKHVGCAHGLWLRNADRYFASARAWDGALTAARCKTLHADAVKLDASSLPPTFWLDADDTTPPTCSMERFVHEVLQFHCRQARLPALPEDAGLATDATAMDATATDATATDLPSTACTNESPTMITGADVSGAEWWVRVKGSDWHKPSVNLHFDADEEMKALSGEHLPPYISTVTYLGSQGAPTVLLPSIGDAHGRALPQKEGHGAFLSHPVTASPSPLAPTHLLTPPPSPLVSPSDPSSAPSRCYNSVAASLMLLLAA